MTFTKISVLVPTRQRLPQLQRLIASFLACTSPNGAELVFRIDDDDPETADYLASQPWSVVVGPRLEGYRSLPVFFQEMAQAASGDVLMCGNDDIVFRTCGWDALVLAEANKYPDGLFDLGVVTHNATVFPFSIISRAAVEAMGHVHDPRLFWGDVFLRDVMRAFGRAIPLPSVRVDHEWMGQTPDVVFREAQQDDPRVWDDAYWALHRQAVEIAVALLRPLLECAA